MVGLTSLILNMLGWSDDDEDDGDDDDECELHTVKVKILSMAQDF